MFGSLGSAVLFRSVGFDDGGEWRVLRVSMSVGDAVGEAEVVDALEEVKGHGTDQVGKV